MGDPLNHCALNVALYGKNGKRWALTERRRGAVHFDASSLTIGPSAVSWENDTLTIRIDEITFPLLGRIRGVVRVHPLALTGHTVALDAEGRHRWSPLAPCSRVEVELTHPALRWSGAGYLDANAGDEPLEQAITDWDWSRAKLRDGAVILYDVRRRASADFSLALSCNHHGELRSLPPPPTASLPRTGWGITRSTRCDAEHTARLVTTLEDTPFYARSLISTHIMGQRVEAMHESLSMDRFKANWVRQLLHFRMPRAWR